MKTNEEIRKWIQDNLLTKNEVITKYNIKSSSFDNYITRSKIKPFIKKGSRINLYLKSDLDNFFSEIDISDNSSKTKIRVNRKKEIKTIIFGDSDAINNDLQEILNNIIESYAVKPVTGHIEISDVSNNPTTGKRTDYSFSKEDIRNVEFQKYIKAALIQETTDLKDKELAKIIDDTSYNYDYLNTIDLSSFQNKKERL